MLGRRTAARGPLSERRTYDFEVFLGIVIGREGLCRCTHQSIGAAELTEHAGSALAHFGTAIRSMPLTDFLDAGQEVDGVFPMTIEKIFANCEFSKRHR
jgi:hypothetical protein